MQLETRTYFTSVKKLVSDLLLLLLLSALFDVFAVPYYHALVHGRLVFISIILSVVLYWYRTWCLAVRKVDGWMEFDKRSAVRNIK